MTEKPVAWGRVIDGKAVTISLRRTIANDEPLYTAPATSPAANKLLYSPLHMEDAEIDKALSSTTPTTRDTFYSILKNYIPGEVIDQAWQELREAGVVP